MGRVAKVVGVASRAKHRRNDALVPAEDMDDEALINAFKAGDASALEMLFRRYRRPVFGWLLQATGDRADAEDLYQEVWLRIVRSASGYTAGGFRSWLWRIVRNGLIDHARKRQPRLTLDEPLSDEEGSEAQVDALADPSFVSALEKMEEEERRVQLRAAIASLSMPLREVVLLRIEGELSFQEIADLLGLKLGTVLARMHHAVRKIKLEVEKVGR